MIKQIQNVLLISNNVNDRRGKETIQTMLHAEKLGSWVTVAGHGGTRRKEDGDSGHSGDMLNKQDGDSGHSGDMLNKQYGDSGHSGDMLNKQDGDSGHSGDMLNKQADDEHTTQLESAVVAPSDQTAAFSNSLSAWLGFEYQYLTSYKLLKLRMFQNCVQTGKRESRERLKTTVVISLEDGGDVVKQKQIGVELGGGKPGRSSSCFFKHLATCTDVRRMALRVRVYVHHGWARKCTCIAEQTVTLGNCNALTPRSFWLNLNKNTII